MRLDLLGWKHALEEAAAAEAAAAAAAALAQEPAARIEPAGPAPADQLGGRPLCLVSTVDYPQWRTVRSVKPPPHSPRSKHCADGRGHRHRRYVRADGTVRTERSDPSRREASQQPILPPIATARNASSWAGAYANRRNWENQLVRHAERQKAGKPPVWEAARRAVNAHNGHKIGWGDAVRPWLVKLGTSPQHARIISIRPAAGILCSSD